jgi:hypothetical protein
MKNENKTDKKQHDLQIANLEYSNHVKQIKEGNEQGTKGDWRQSHTRLSLEDIKKEKAVKKGGSHHFICNNNVAGALKQ